MRPVATNVSIQIDGVDAHDMANEKLPDLYYGAPIWAIGRFQKAGMAKVTVTAEVLGQPFHQEMEIDFPQTSDGNPEIERMWAFEKVQTLMNRMRASQEDPQAVDEIVRLLFDRQRICVLYCSGE